MPEGETAVTKIDARSLARVERYVTITALNIPEGLTYDQWADLGRGLNVSRKMVKSASHMWWIGDWLAYGEHNIGEAYAAAVESTGYEKNTLYQAKTVSLAIPPKRRREGLTWSHHRAVVSLSEADQDHLLDMAIEDGLTQAQVKKMASAIKAAVAGEVNGAPAAEQAGEAGQERTEEELPSPEATEQHHARALEALKRDFPIANQMIDDFTSLSYNFWECVNNDQPFGTEDLAKLQATAKALSEVTGRMASTIYALL